MAQPNKSLDASGGGVFRNLLGAAHGALISAAASTQPLGVTNMYSTRAVKLAVLSSALVLILQGESIATQTQTAGKVEGSIQDLRYGGTHKSISP